MSLGNLFGMGNKKAETPPPPPAPPQPEVIKEESKKKLRQGVSGKSQTVFTSPLGVTDSANLGKKDVLGA